MGRRPLTLSPRRSEQPRRRAAGLARAARRSPVKRERGQRAGIVQATKMTRPPRPQRTDRSCSLAGGGPRGRQGLLTHLKVDAPSPSPRAANPERSPAPSGLRHRPARPSAPRESPLSPLTGACGSQGTFSEAASHPPVRPPGCSWPSLQGELETVTIFKDLTRELSLVRRGQV